MIRDVSTGTLAAISQRNATNRENSVAITAERTSIGDAGQAGTAEVGEEEESGL